MVAHAGKTSAVPRFYLVPQEAPFIYDCIYFLSTHIYIRYIGIYKYIYAFTSQEAVLPPVLGLPYSPSEGEAEPLYRLVCARRQLR